MNIGVFGFVFGAFFGVGMELIIVISEYIPIVKQNWKCTDAIVIDNDPSKTECVVYRRKDKLTENVNSN